MKLFQVLWNEKESKQCQEWHQKETYENKEEVKSPHIKYNFSYRLPTIKNNKILIILFYKM